MDPCATSIPPSPVIRPKLPRLHTLKTFNLPPHKVDDLLTSAATSALATPSTEFFGGRPLNILVAPSGFKESLGPESVADAIEAGVRKVVKEDEAFVRKIPLHDGGEGFCRALVAAQDGDIMEYTVTGPMGCAVTSHLGFIGEDKKTAVMDMAAAAGLRLVPKDSRDPTITTTYGVGELIEKALDQGCTKIIIGCGDSGTSDGGAGMLQALGIRLLDAKGEELPKAGGGQSLLRLHKIEWNEVHPRLRNNAVQIEVVCNIKNVLCGPKGVARIYGPQKGATPEQVELLSAALERLAHVAGQNLKADISTIPGSGASGGLGAGLMLIGAYMRPRSDAINEYFELDSVFHTRWDFVITAEGSLDSQSTEGKMTTEVARRAKRHGAQVVALAGTIGEGADVCYGAGIKAFTSIQQGPSSLEKAIQETERLLKTEAENMLRMIMVGLTLGQREA
ncbi:hypothetical protein N0V90_012409 [Kalmusia sp. IMI 367209]|nr:hypothetical protein N0V90_012409 [Kalmusia sp. IMI 367209]